MSRFLLPYLFLFFFLHNIDAQVFTVSGVVTSSEDNQPLIGANVLEKGTLDKGTTTDVDGSFRLTVSSANAVLIFSYVGYEAQEVPVQGRAQLLVALAPESELMQEVVVTGYRREIRSDVASAITSVKARDIERLVVVGIDQALQGQAPGVSVTQVTGSPGDDIAVRIRGVGTLGNNNPLYVIDGVPTTGGLNMFSLTDIESIEVLKDAAAAAIYGSRAANGVVLITTKRGKAGPPVFSFEAYGGVQEPVRLPQQEYLTIRNEAITNANLLRSPVNQLPTYDRAILDTLPDNDWLDIMFSPASVQRYSLSARGGAETSSFYISGEYLSQDGIFKGQSFDKYQVRFNGEIGRDRFRVGSNMVFSHTDRRVINGSGDGFGQGNELSGVRYALIASPVFPSQYPDGRYINVTSELGDPVLFGDGNANPIVFVENTDWTIKRYRLFGNVFAEWEILKDLKLRTTLGGDFLFDREKLFKKRLSAAVYDPTSLNEGRVFNQTLVWNNTVDFQRTFGGHRITALAGMEAIQNHTDYLGASANNFRRTDLLFRYIDASTHPLGIGYDPIDNANFFNGILDEVMLFDVALSDAQVTALFNTLNTAPNIPNGRVAQYSFDGNGLDGADFGGHADIYTAAFTTDRFGYGKSALLCGGVQSEVTAPASTHLNSANTTVSFWVKPNSLPGNGEAFLLSLGGWQERWKISLPPHGKPVWTTNYTGGISDMDSGDGNTLTVGTWTHVVMVHDGAKDEIYFDGVLVAEKNVTGTLNNTTYSLGIGYNVVDGGNWFDGLLDEVQIYNVALDDAAIAALYAEQSEPPAGGDNEAPNAPLNLAANVAFNNVELSWLPAIDNVNVTAYNVYIDGVSALSTAATNAYFAELTPLTEYQFGVTAVDEAGNESLPTTLNVTTGPDETPDVTPPSVPGNLSGSPSFNSVLLNWDASTDDTQVSGYIILDDGEPYDTVPANTLNILVGGLEPTTLYSFEVAAFDLAGNVSAYAELTLSTTEPLVTAEPGLVAHYPFDGNANDATPYANHGVIGGNPVFQVPDHPNSGGMNIKFDGMQDSVLAPNAVQLLSDYTTVSFWIRVDGQNIQDAEAYVLDFGHWNQRWKISLPQHLKIVWTTNSNNAQFPNFISDMYSGDGNEMVIGFWWYVTMVHDGTDDIIYVNGVEANRKPALGKLNSTALPLGFGNNPIEGGQYFNGALDNVKIYNKALTAEEAAALFQNGTTGIGEVNLVNAYIDQVFPSPATEHLTVRHSLPSNQPLLLRVFDTQGRQVDAFAYNQSDVASGQFSINVSNYPQGLYSLNFILGGKNLGSVKFNKQ